MMRYRKKPRMKEARDPVRKKERKKEERKVGFGTMYKLNTYKLFIRQNFFLTMLLG